MFWRNFSTISDSTIAMWQKKNAWCHSDRLLKEWICLRCQSGEHGKGSNASVPDFLLTTGAVLGCGTVPAASRTWRFNVTGFSLPVAMAFSTDAAAWAQVLDVLEQHGRAAGLPDYVITTILDQLGINVLYTPLPCPKVSVSPPAMVDRDVMPTMTACVISATQ
ncbi:hypothetical protein KIN20_014276 [Parelaphostrongylus tenuis]|uniref:Uncharacterized protein n=1 Tax=Parelaphostrongylus tenuis TaxID=148309 RepID=A0AAD5QRQ6_PARTN|nr:hypothetical protein KIN20_014276 [Parelaphostrongylus tenuis]